MRFEDERRAGTDHEGAGRAGEGGPLRFGILGAARIADLALFTPARETGDRLVAVAARSVDRARAFAETHRIERVHSDYAGVCADPEVEIVYNPLANALHGPWNLAAVRAGKHVLSEKPFAANAVEARYVAAAAREAGVTVVEGFHYLHHPVMRRVLELLDSGEIGRPSRVEVHMSMAAPADTDPRWSWELAGGATMDLGCYALHAHRVLGRWFGGAPSVVAGRAKERAGHPGVDEWLEADLEFPGGGTGFVRCSMDDEPRMTLRVVGTAGELTAANFVLPHRDDRIIVRTKTGERTELLGRRSSYLYQLEALGALLRAGAGSPSEFPVDLDDAVANAELVDAAYLAAGLPVRAALTTSEVTG